MAQFDYETTSDEAAQAFSKEIQGKNVIVTGASPGGLGAETARVLTKYAALVVIAGRDQAKLDETARAIRVETPSANLRTLIIDLNSFDSTRKAAAEVNAYREPIHVLINNAAVMATPYSKSIDGFETQLATNHLGPFLFTSLIFPKLKSSSSSSSPARIVNVASVGHQFGPFRFEDYNFEDGNMYEPWVAYGASKTANILMANEIARRAQQSGVPVLAFSLHPGGIDTPLARHISDQTLIDLGYRSADGKWLIPLKTVPQGAATQIVAAFNPSLATQSGAYLVDSNISEKDRLEYARSEENGRKLWDLSERLVSQSFEI